MTIFGFFYTDFVFFLFSSLVSRQISLFDDRKRWLRRFLFHFFVIYSVVCVCGWVEDGITYTCECLSSSFFWHDLDFFYVYDSHHELLCVWVPFFFFSAAVVWLGGR